MNGMQACGLHHSGNLLQEVQQLLSSKAAAGAASQDKPLGVGTSGRQQEACGHAPLLNQAAKRVHNNTKARMLARVHCNGYSEPVLVLGALGVQALLKSAAMTKDAR